MRPDTVNHFPLLPVLRNIRKISFGRRGISPTSNVEGEEGKWQINYKAKGLTTKETKGTKKNAPSPDCCITGKHSIRLRLASAVAEAMARRAGATRRFNARCARDCASFPGLLTKAGMNNFHAHSIGERKAAEDCRSPQPRGISTGACVLAATVFLQTLQFITAAKWHGGKGSFLVSHPSP
ncbi:MAG TPA: hypothetical protein VGI03_04060 [Verrucomicrobiae bacterium]|jgi:hypothetical protein